MGSRELDAERALSSSYRCADVPDDLPLLFSAVLREINALSLDDV